MKVNERKPLEYYISLKYPVTLVAAPEGGYFVKIEDLPLPGADIRIFKLETWYIRNFR